MKTQDWDDFLEWLRESDLEGKGVIETTLTRNTKVYHSRDDIKRIMKPPRGMGLPTVTPPSGHLSFSKELLQVLVDFGHTPTEVKEYFDKKDKEFWDKVLPDPVWDDLIGKAFGELDHWNSAVGPMTKWMKENKRKFIEHYTT